MFRAGSRVTCPLSVARQGAKRDCGATTPWVCTAARLLRLFFCRRRGGWLPRFLRRVRRVERGNQGEIFIEPMLADRHDGVGIVVEIKQECGGNAVVALDDPQVAQFARAEQALCRRVIIEIRHEVSFLSRCQTFFQYPRDCVTVIPNERGARFCGRHAVFNE